VRHAIGAPMGVGSQLILLSRKPTAWCEQRVSAGYRPRGAAAALAAMLSPPCRSASRKAESCFPTPFQGVTLVSGHRHTAGRKILHRRIKILDRGPPHIPAVVRLIVRPPAMHRASVVPDHQIAD
jgi:hypothetical protein